MSTKNIKLLYNEIKNIKDNRSIVDNISDRLEKNLKLYIKSLSNATENLSTKKTTTIYKEINK